MYMNMTYAEEYAVDFEILAILERIEKASSAFEEDLKKEDREFEHVND